MNKKCFWALSIFIMAGTIVSLTISFVPPTGAQAKPIYVIEGSSGNGTSWADASGNLQDALDMAVPGDEIWVAAGIYTPIHPGSPGARTDSFSLKKDVAIYGGFAGTETSLDLRNCQQHKTILSGEIGNPGTITDNCYHVFYHPEGKALTNSAVLDGCIITGGNADGTGEHANGGGMFNESGSPSIINCTFRSNHASANGGAIYNAYSPASIKSCVFYDNDAQYGGAVFNDSQSSVTLTNCTIYGNSASFGGGIANTNYSLPVITNCIVWGNTASGTDNEVYNDTASPYITYSNVEGGWPGIGNISGSPMFVDAPNGDFHLRPSSICINVGDNSAPDIPLHDFEGDNRIINGIVDMGADEYFDVATYDLIINITGKGSVVPPAGVHSYTKGQLVPIIASASWCWQFDKWSGETGSIGNVNDPSTTIIMDSDYSVTATFKPIQRKLTLAGHDAFDVFPYEGTQLQNCGDTIDISGMITDCCFGFTGWEGNMEYLTDSPSFLNNSLVMPSRDITIIAVVDMKETMLNLYSTSGGSTLPHQTGTIMYSYECGSNINIEAIPDACQQFVHWTGDTHYLNNGTNVANNSLTLPCETVNLTANFIEKDISLTTSSSTGGSVIIPGEGTFPYKCGTIVSITATGSPDHVFAGWSGDGVSAIVNPGSPDTTIIMDDSYLITANFALEGCVPLHYDSNHNSKIDFNEMVDALMDYLGDKLEFPCMMDVLMSYLTD